MNINRHFNGYILVYMLDLFSVSIQQLRWPFRFVDAENQTKANQQFEQWLPNETLHFHSTRETNELPLYY